VEEQARVISAILKELATQCLPGVTGHHIADLCDVLIAKHGATSYNKGYHPKWSNTPFPSSICISPNGITAHGLPTKYALKEGDIVSLDVGIKKDGLCGDAAITVPVGKIDNKTERLLYYAKCAVYETIKLMQPGANTRDIAAHVQSWGRQRGYTVIRTAAGHRIGEEMHMKPNIYSTVEDDEHTYATLKVGQVFCVEPILTTSRDSLGATLGDGWTKATMDGKNAAMFEHMVKITADGPVVLTDHFSNPKL
jgi:methionyl aminopeptidase